MKKIAITGNIASGKSQVEKELISLGFKVVDTDKINHEILENDKITIQEIKNAFSDYDILDEQGKLLREKIGKIVFSNNEKKQILEGILHQKIYEKLEAFYENNKDEKLVFISIPLLFEAKQEDKFDKIVFISANEELRLKRLIERNNYDIEYAKKRIAAQEKEQIKIEKSDFVIYNNSDLSNLKNQIKEVLNQLILCC